MNNTYSEAGIKTDERNLIEDWKNKKGNRFIYDKQGFDALKPSTEFTNVLGTKFYKSYIIKECGCVPHIILVRKKKGLCRLGYLDFSKLCKNSQNSNFTKSDLER